MFRNERQTTTTATCTEPSSSNRKKGKGRKRNDAASDVTCKITSIRLTLYRVFISTHFFLSSVSLSLTHSDVCLSSLCPSIRFLCITIFNVNMLGSSVDRLFVCATKRLNNGQTHFSKMHTHTHSLKLPNQFDCTFRFSLTLFPYFSLLGDFFYSISFSGFPS